MHCRLAPAPDGPYIHLEISGVLTRRLALEYMLAAHVLGRELGLDRYLVDLTRSRNVDAILNTYDLVYEDLQQTSGIDLTARIVLLVSLGDNSHDVFESICQSAGLDVTLFRNRKRALAHLLGEPPALDSPTWRYL